MATFSGVFIPSEIHYMIINSAEWYQYATMSRVCKAWRDIILSSPEYLYEPLKLDLLPVSYKKKPRRGNDMYISRAVSCYDRLKWEEEKLIFKLSYSEPGKVDVKGSKTEKVDDVEREIDIRSFQHLPAFYSLSKKPVSLYDIKRMHPVFSYSRGSDVFHQRTFAVKAEVTVQYLIWMLTSQVVERLKFERETSCLIRLPKYASDAVWDGWTFRYLNTKPVLSVRSSQRHIRLVFQTGEPRPEEVAVEQPQSWGSYLLPEWVLRL